MAFVVVVLFYLFILFFFYIYFKRLTCNLTKPLTSSSVAGALPECYKNAGHWGSRREILPVRGGPLEKLWRNGEFLSRGNFFSLSNSFMNFSFRPQHEYFLGLLACMNFFHLIFPCANIYFLYFARLPPPPPPPIMFVSIHEK